MIDYWLGMYSGLLPKGLTEEDLSSEDEEQDEEEEKRRMVKEPESSAGKLNSTRENTGSLGEAQSTPAEGDAESEYPTCSLPGVSQEMWQVCGSYTDV